MFTGHLGQTLTPTQHFNIDIEFLCLTSWATALQCETVNMYITCTAKHWEDFHLDQLSQLFYWTLCVVSPFPFHDDFLIFIFSQLSPKGPDKILMSKTGLSPYPPPPPPPKKKNVQWGTCEYVGSPWANFLRNFTTPPLTFLTLSLAS